MRMIDSNFGKTTPKKTRHRLHAARMKESSADESDAGWKPLLDG